MAIWPWTSGKKIEHYLKKIQSLLRKQVVVLKVQISAFSVSGECRDRQEKELSRYGKLQRNSRDFFFMYVEKRREEVSECHKAFIVHLF